MTDDLKKAIEDRGITRLCHFTPSRNLQHIAAGSTGILATKSLMDEERNLYNPTDLERLDGHRGHVCCSIEYPNAWYFAKAQQNEILFPDWVVLLINPKHLWAEGTLFSPRNAAAGYGRLLRPGKQGFDAMFAATVTGAYNRQYSRSPLHHPACPTDQQAEVLVSDVIPIEDILAVGVKDQEQAATERVRLRINGLDPDQFRFQIVPHMFSSATLNHVVRSGHRPAEPVATFPESKN